MSKSIKLDISGPQHPTVEQDMYESYLNLFNVVKKHYPTEKLSRFFPLQGEYYNEYLQLTSLAPCELEQLSDEEIANKYMEPAVRLMIVGRCVNGWTELTEMSGEEFANAAANTITRPGFSWLRDDGQGTDTYLDSENREKRYNINRSPFFRCTKQILNQLKPISAVHDRWFEHMVWSNLYTIAPPDTGNAVGKLQDIQVDISKQLLLHQIKYFAPTHILFITDWDYWFERFADIFPDVKKIGNSVNDNIVGAGKYDNIKIVVSVRPDRTRPNKPDETQFAADAVKIFQQL